MFKNYNAESVYQSSHPKARLHKRFPRVRFFKTKKLLIVFNGSDFIYAHFSPDGQHIAAGTTEEAIYIWDFPSLQELINENRERFKDNPLMPEERRILYVLDNNVRDIYNQLITKTIQLWKKLCRKNVN